MNNPNPLIPQGSLLEQKAKGKPHLRVACIIVAVHLVFLGGLLIQGCKREGTGTKTAGQTNEITLPPLESSNLYSTNPVVTPTNPSASALTETSAPTMTNPIAEPYVARAANTLEPASTGSQEHSVAQGDTFSSLAKKYGVSVSAITKANPGVDSSRLRIGQKLVIPAPSSSPTTAQSTMASVGGNVYVVKPGDTLGKIAKAHGTTINEIKELNGLKTDRINVGKKLNLPALKTAPEPATTPAPQPNTGSIPAGSSNNI